MKHHKPPHDASDTAPRLDLRYMNLTPANLRIWFRQKRTGFVYGVLACALFATVLILLTQPYKVPAVPAGGRLVRVIPDPTFYIIQAGHQLTLVRNRGLTADIILLSFFVFFITATITNFIKDERFYNAKQHHGHRVIHETRALGLLRSYLPFGFVLAFIFLLVGLISYSFLSRIIYPEVITFDPSKNLVSENGTPLGPMSDIQRFYRIYHPGHRTSTVEWGVITKEGRYFAFNNDMDLGPDIFYMGNNNPPLISYLNDYIKSYQREK